MVTLTMTSIFTFTEVVRMSAGKWLGMGQGKGRHLLGCERGMSARYGLQNILQIVFLMQR
jgi:hypothetical protein